MSACKRCCARVMPGPGSSGPTCLEWFDDRDTAEQYALRLAETKADWKVDVHDVAGTLVATYNSEDDGMPKPAIE